MTFLLHASLSTSSPAVSAQYCSSLVASFCTSCFQSSSVYCYHHYEIFLCFMLPDYKVKNAEVDGCAGTAGAANVTSDRLSKVVGQQFKG